MTTSVVTVTMGETADVDLCADDTRDPEPELGKEEELDGGAEVDGNIELLELAAVSFPAGPQGPVTIKLALTPPVVPELVTVMSSQKSGKTIS